MKKLLSLFVFCLCAATLYAAYTPGRGTSGGAEIPEGTWVAVPTEITDGMVIKFDWEDAAGGNSTNLVSAYDVVKATMTNGASHTADAFGSMDTIEMTNSTNYVAVTGSHTYLSQYSAWTVCMWVYASTTTANGFYFFDKENSSAGCEFYTHAPANGGLSLSSYLDMVVPYSSALTTAKPVPLKDLVLVSLVFNRVGEADFTFQVNSTVYTPTARNLGSGGQSNDSANEWHLGNVWSGARALIGSLGPVRVYSRALSSIELESLYEFDKYTYGIN